MINDFDLGCVADIFQRVAVQDDKICKFAGLKRSSVRCADYLTAFVDAEVVTLNGKMIRLCE